MSKIVGIIHLSLFILTIFMTCPAFAATITLPKTGQTACYDAGGITIACAGTGQDGALLKGVAWPIQRFTDNGNGTVTDNLTELIWLKNANCTDTAGGIAKGSGYLSWPDALAWSNALNNGKCGLTDGSAVGQWRLPNITELESLVDAQRIYPALPAAHPFSGVQSNNYWSSSTNAGYTSIAWYVDVSDGYGFDSNKTSNFYVWPVRAGQ